MLQGIDVSHHQGNIDWSKLKSSGKVNFAMIRTGYGVKNPNQTDKKFTYNIDTAMSLGIPVGVYHYSYANSREQAAQEARFCLEILDGRELQYPIAYDIEDESLLRYNQQTKTDMCKAFCEVVKTAGYIPMIYCSLYFLKNHLYAEQIANYDLWLAEWGEKGEPSVPCAIWQSTDSWYVDGIRGKVDLDHAFKSYGGNINNNPTNKPNVTIPNNKVIEYTVQKGDSLWDIAAKFLGKGELYTKIAKNNGISNPNLLTVGKVLKIYTSEQGITGKKYAVQKGDTLWDIAAKEYGNGAMYKQIMDKNNLNSEKIFPGQVLEL